MIRKNIKRLTFTLIFVGTALGVSACSPKNNWQDESSLGDIEERDIEESEEQSTKTESFKEGSKNSLIESLSQETSKEETVSSNINLTGKYYYDLLTDDEKGIYEKIYLLGSNFQKELDLSDLNINEATFCKVWASFNYDNPELFWCNNLAYNSFNDKIMNISFYIQEDIKEKSEKVSNEMTKIISNTPQNSNNYEKAKYFYDYLIDNTTYAKEEYIGNTIDTVLLNKEANSEGLARTFKALCDSVNINCVYAKALKDDTSFSLNLINIDNNWYWIDIINGKLLENKGDYFCISDEEINKIYKIDTGIKVVIDRFEDVFIYPNCSITFKP